jgi:hypothetical protein
MTDSDQDLRDRFRALRQEEETRAPELADLLRRVPVRASSKSARRLIVAAALLAATVATVLLFWPTLPSFHQNPGKPVVSITQWKSPTEFLLDTPGRDILRTVPSMGVWHESEFTSPAKQKHRQAETQPLL